MLNGTPLTWACLIYVCVVGIILLVKPAFLYDHQAKEYKTFGYGENRTRVPLWLICLIVAVISYGLACFGFNVMVRAPQHVGAASTTVSSPTLYADPSPPPQPSPPVATTLPSSHAHGGVRPSKIPDSKLWNAAMQ
jgi:hypothetical protein